MTYKMLRTELWFGRLLRTKQCFPNNHVPVLAVQQKDVKFLSLSLSLSALLLPETLHSSEPCFDMGSYGAQLTPFSQLHHVHAHSPDGSRLPAQVLLHLQSFSSVVYAVCNA